MKLGKKAARPGAVSFKFAAYANTAALPKPPKTFGHEREKYGRVLAGITIGGVDICAAMINNGWAVQMLRMEYEP